MKLCLYNLRGIAEFDQCMSYMFMKDFLYIHVDKLYIAISIFFYFEFKSDGLLVLEWLQISVYSSYWCFHGPAIFGI